MRTPPPPSLPPGSEVGGYVLDERIGAGGFGEVYRAHHPVIGSVVAIKLLHARYSHDPEAVARFVDEARAVNRITHAGIVQVFDFGRAHDREYFVMELLDGRSLRDVLAERGKLPLAEALPILRGIAAAIDAANTAGIAHRDLKPENVFVLADGRTKLIDFGLAKLTRDAEPVTESGSVFGTPLYMSPEQCRGRGVDTRTDIYSFGALAYHVLTGAPPFTGEPIELALHHVNDPPPAPRVSRTVDRVLLALLAKDPAARPASLGAAVAAIEGSARLPVRKRFFVVPLLVVAAGASIAFVATRPSKSPDRTAFWTAKRPELERRFASHTDWPLARAKLDGAAARWTAAWSRAHKLDEEPLLHAQRLACLENVLLDLETAVDVVSSLDVTTFEVWDPDSALGSGGRALSDCDNAAVLRAQVAPPPVPVRARVSAKQREVQRAIADGWLGWMHRDLGVIDQQTAQLDVLARELEALHASAASAAILARVELLVQAAYDNDVRRLAGVDAARAEAASRLEASRDDIGLAQAHLAIASDALHDAYDVPSLAAASALLDRAEQTVARAGRPARGVQALSMLRSELATRRGNFDEAVTQVRNAIAVAEAEHLDTIPLELQLIAVLARGEHLAEARAEAQRLLDAAPIPQRFIYVALVAQLAGALETAVAFQREFAARMGKKRSMPERRNGWGDLYVLELELQRGKLPDDRDAVIRAIAGLGTTPPLHSPDGVATARRAGLYAIFQYATTRLDLAAPEDRTDHAATIAFHRGDLPLAKQLGREVVARCAAMYCGDHMRFGRWLALLGERDLEPALAALEAEYKQSPYAIAYSGILLAHAQQWPAAKQRLAAARAVPNVWNLQADLADLDTWLGLAQRQAGDLDGARYSFEEALDVISIRHNGPDGFSYTTPMAQAALAKLLAESDPARSAALAARAKAGFERLR